MVALDPIVAYLFTPIVVIGFVLSALIVNRARKLERGINWTIAAVSMWVLAVLGYGLGVFWSLLLPYAVVLLYLLLAWRRKAGARRRQGDAGAVGR